MEAADRFVKVRINMCCSCLIHNSKLAGSKTLQKVQKWRDDVMERYSTIIRVAESVISLRYNIFKSYNTTFD